MHKYISQLLAYSPHDAEADVEFPFPSPVPITTIGDVTPDCTLVAVPVIVSVV